MPALARIQHAAWREAFVPLLPAAFELPPLERFHAMLGRNDARRVLALEQDLPAGWVSLGVSLDADRAAGTGELRALFVDPGHWRRGVGRALVRHTLEALSEMGYEEVTVWSFADNAPANRLYESAGFDRDGAERREPIFAEALQVRYRRPLQG